ncbi:GSCOCG00011033001-RA-CDS [Cotesia congregata]|nr:GSCOCG00011033001-RA-CDS [Cotesia congregata]
MACKIMKCCGTIARAPLISRVLNKGPNFSHSILQHNFKLPQVQNSLINVRNVSFFNRCK